MGKPWVNQNGDVVHPNAPRGGGGAGFFRECGPLGCDTDAGIAVPHPHSPGARYIALNDKQKKHLKRKPAPKPHGTPAPTLAPKTQEELQGMVKDNAAKLVGKPVVGDGECFAMIDSLLAGSGAKTAHDFGKVTHNANYEWGTPIQLSDVKPGDILQFRNHEITIVTQKTTVRTSPKSKEIGGAVTDTKSRGHHSAVVLSNDGNGVLTVAEQHVKDPVTKKLSHTIRQNTLYTQDVPAKTIAKKKWIEKNGGEVEETTTLTITVTGTIWAYRPETKD